MTVILFMEKGYTRISAGYGDGSKTYLPLKFTLAGIIPAIGGEWLLALPVTILGFPGMTGRMGYQVSKSLFDFSTGRSVWYYVSLCRYYYSWLILLFLFHFFIDPKVMASLLRTGSASILSPGGENEETDFDQTS